MLSNCLQPFATSLGLQTVCEVHKPKFVKFAKWLATYRAIYVYCLYTLQFLALAL